MRVTRPLSCALLVLAAFACSTSAQARDSFHLCWSPSAISMPWGYAAQQKIVAKWARKYKISIEMVRIDNPADAVKQYSSGQVDGCTMNNIDALTSPAAMGVDTSVLIISGYSHGDDCVLLRGQGKHLRDLNGQHVQATDPAAHYLLNRAVQMGQMNDEDVQVSTLSTDELAASYGKGDTNAAATSNPTLSRLLAQKDATQVFSSRRIPGEIVEMMVVNTQTLKDNPALGRALVGAWFETMKLIRDHDAKGAAIVGAMAKAAGTTTEDFKTQWSKFRPFYTPRFAVEFAESNTLPTTMQRVAEFAFAHKLLGKATSAESVGVSFANGVVTGSPANTKLRFEPAFMRLAQDGKL